MKKNTMCSRLVVGLLVAVYIATPLVSVFADTSGVASAAADATQPSASSAPAVSNDSPNTATAMPNAPTISNSQSTGAVDLVSPGNSTVSADAASASGDTKSTATDSTSSTDTASSKTDSTTLTPPAASSSILPQVPSYTPPQSPKTPEIDKNTGALTYSYPIQIPPGRNNLQPNLSLSYNSNAGDQQSIFGYDWSLSIPYIERLAKTGVDQLYSTSATNYFYSSLDGELVSVSGSSTTYIPKTENGAFNQYSFSSNGWIVLSKDGTKYTFGLDVSGQQTDPQNLGHVYKWMLQEIRDANNNYVSFSYTKDAGQIYPAAIKYTGNGSTDGIFEIDFQKTARPDNSPSFHTGFSVASNFYINEIDAKVSGVIRQKYLLSYQTSADSQRSLLHSITQYGYDVNGVVTTLPSTTFNYQGSTLGWASPDPLWAIPNPPAGSWFFPATGAPQFVDLNGDGLVDMIAFSQISSSTWQDYEYLNTGHGWTLAGSQWNIPIPSGFSNPLRQPEFTDLNGDGLSDVVVFGNTQPYQDYEYLNNGHGWVLADSLWNIPAAPAGSWLSQSPAGMLPQFTDLNGDGLPDIFIISQISNNSYQDYEYLNSGHGWISAGSSWNIPVVFSNPLRLPQFTDLNGDGLSDMVVIDNAQPYQDHEYLNTGHGWTLADSLWNIPAAPAGYWTFNSPTGALPEFVDINGDGLPDIVIISQIAVGVYQDYEYLNNGHGWTMTNNWTIPAPLQGYWPYYRGFLPPFADLNGDGLSDMIGISEIGGSNTTFQDYEYIHSGNKTDLLNQIIYPQGGNTAVTYKAAALYTDASGNHTNSSPYPIFTVLQIVHNDGLGSNTSALYQYQNGQYYYQDPFNKQFSGYKTITQTDGAGNVTKTYYNTGLGTDTANGQYQDDFYKIGKPYRVEVMDSPGNLYTRIINKWDEADLGSGSKFVFLANTVNYAFDGGVSHRDTAQAYTYNNSSGNLVQKIQYGEVAANNDGTFTDIGSDLFTTSNSYAVSNQPFLVNLQSQATVLDQAGNKVKESRFYYDNQALGSATVGNLTKGEDWKSGTSYSNSQKTYNSYGLVTVDTDPRGNATQYVYDTYNLYPVTVTNALNQSTQYAYDYASGQVTQKTDPNTRVYQYVFDGLGRLLQENEPDITTPATLVTKTKYVYNDVPVPTNVHVFSYLDSTTAAESYTYFDGLGRKVWEKSKAENGNFSVKDFQYNSLGLLSRESLPYFSTSTGNPTPNTDTNLFTSYIYDPLGRVISAANVLGTTTTAYNQWKTTVTDANGKSKDYCQDAYGNLIQVDEHNAGTTYSTYYGYDYLGDLTKITDALGNVRNFTYDGLGRRLTAQDLHSPADATFGTWKYAYDDAGNLTQTIDPKNQTVNYTYDVINRVLSEDYTGTTGTEVTYTYDVGTDGIGRVNTITTTPVIKVYTYNPLGLVKQEVDKLNTNYTSTYTYGRQGNQTLVTNPDNSQIKFIYNVAGLLDQIQRKESTDAAFSNVVSNFDYSPEGKVATQTDANGVVTTNTYDATKLYRLTNKVTANSAGLHLQDMSYTYDPVGNITQLVDASAGSSAKTAVYMYDDLYRLTSATISSVASGQSPYTQTYTYNAIGNIITKSDVAGTYTYANTGYANPHAVTSIGSVTLTYDNNGNLTKDNNGFTNSWNYRNRLTKSTNGTVTDTYTYDTDNERVKLTSGTTSTYYPTKFYSVAGTTKIKHIFANGTDVATIQGTGTTAAIYYNASDLLNSSSVMTDSTGAVVEAMDYYPFGSLRFDNQATSGGQPVALSEQRKYIGQEYDPDTGLAYLNARYYNATLAKFTSEDPVFLVLGDSNKVKDMTGKDQQIVLSDPQQLNSYSYSENNPIIKSDPSGEISITPPQVQALQKALVGMQQWFATVSNSQIASTGINQAKGNSSDDLKGNDQMLKLAMGFVMPEEGMMEEIPNVAKGFKLGQEVKGFGRVIENSSDEIKGFFRPDAPEPYHGLDRAIERGVSPKMLLDTVKNPLISFEQANGNIYKLSRDAAVVLDQAGKVVTTYSWRQFVPKVLQLMNKVK